MATNIHDRMTALGITQAKMVLLLREKGIIVQVPEISTIVRGINTYPKAVRVLEACDEILTELENE